MKSDEQNHDQVPTMLSKIAATAIARSTVTLAEAKEVNKKEEDSDCDNHDKEHMEEAAEELFEVRQRWPICQKKKSFILCMICFFSD